MVGSEITRPFITRIPSGSLSLDVVLGGGWPTNHWNEIVGSESGGKTMLVLKTIAVNQKRDPNWTAVWFAAEDFVESYAQMFGCDLDRIVVVNENTIETVGELARDFINTKSVDAVVIDSLPALTSRREAAGTMDDLQPGQLAFLTGKFFRMVGYGMGRSITDEDERPCTGFVINQWREKITSYGDPRTTPGGKAKNFAYFTRVEVAKDEWIETSKNKPIGQKLRIKNLKNKQAPPGRLAYVDAYFADGNGFKAGDFDTVKDLIDTGIAYEVIERDGSYYSFGGKRWFGRPKLVQSLRKDEELQEKLSAAVLTETTWMEEPPPRKKGSSTRAAVRVRNLERRETRQGRRSSREGADPAPADARPRKRSQAGRNPRRQADR